MTDNQPLNPGNGGEVRPVGPLTANDAFGAPGRVEIGSCRSAERSDLPQRRRCSPTRGAGEPWAR